MIVNIIKPGFGLTEDRKTLITKIKDKAIIERIRSMLIGVPNTIWDVPNGSIIALPNTMDSYRLLRNANLDVTGIEPIRYKYELPLAEGKYALMPHQITTAAFLCENRRGYCASTMRTGKTLSALLAADFLRREGLISSTLIITVFGGLWGTWERAIKTSFPGRSCQVLWNSDINQRRELLDKYADFYIINHDGVELLTDELCAKVECGAISCCIVDESTFYGNVSTDLWKSADVVINGNRWKAGEPNKVEHPNGVVTVTYGHRRRLESVRGIEYCWAFTGTPGDAEKVHGQVSLITPGNMPMTKGAWKNTTMERIPNSTKWVKRYNHDALIAQVMQPCIRFVKEDVMDLPPVIPDWRDAPLSKEQAKLYTEMKRTCMAKATGGETITAVNKAAMSTKLLQIAAGDVITDDGVKSLDATPKLTELKKIISEAHGKVVVYANYTAVVDRLVTEIETMGYTVTKVDGTVTGKRRSDRFYAFLEEKDPRVIVCHIQTTAFCVELASADTMVFYGPPLCGDVILSQALERISSLRQAHTSCRVVYLMATPEERRVMRDQLNGVSSSEAVANLFTSIVNNDSSVYS